MNHQVPVSKSIKKYDETFTKEKITSLAFFKAFIPMDEM